jgi:hypothetical protein
MAFQVEELSIQLISARRSSQIYVSTAGDSALLTHPLTVRVDLAAIDGKAPGDRQ